MLQRGVVINSLFKAPARSVVVDFFERSRDVLDEALTKPLNVANLRIIATGYHKDCTSLPPRAFRCHPNLFVGIDILK